MPKKLIFITYSFFCLYSLSAQKYETGLIYVNGLAWTENTKGDSIIDIIIEKDTIETIRNLLVYCLLIKDESDASRLLLSTINLDHLQKAINSHCYDISFSYYKKAINKTKKYSKYK